MKLSSACTYALHAVAHMVTAKEGQLVHSHVIAQAEGLSGPFLLRVLNWLVRAQILLSNRGASGGYRLARPAHKITLLEIIEAVDGPIHGDASHAEGAGSPGVQEKLRAVCQRLADETRRQLGRVTIADLTK